MANLKMRPRFAIDVRCDVETLVKVLGEGIARTDPPLEGHFDPARCVLRIPGGRRYLWSPELDVTFEPLEGREDPSDGLRVRCLFTPRPAVWTVFAFCYAVIAFVGMAGGFYGLAQLTMGHPPRAFWITVGAAGLIAAIYGATFMGQGLAATQMYEMRRYLDEGLAQAESRARTAPLTPLDSARL